MDNDKTIVAFLDLLGFSELTKMVNCKMNLNR